MSPITKEVAAHVLFHFRGEGYPPGSFTETLLLAFARADSRNFMKLDMAFPDYGELCTSPRKSSTGSTSSEQSSRGSNDVLWQSELVPHR